ncbi:hypothetical protein LTR17_006373 [Elasticomyces elasticus]|nr:hypothetical protein LTR17_006373 [Elasticomyces elasticus]
METPKTSQQDFSLPPGGLVVSMRESMIVRLALPSRGANVQMRDNSSRDDGGVEIETSITPRARAPRVAVDRGTPRRSARRRRLPPPGAYEEDDMHESDEDSAYLHQRTSNTGNEAKSKPSRSTISGKGAYPQHHNQDMDDEELPLVKHEDAHHSNVRYTEDVQAGHADADIGSHGGRDRPTVHGAAAANFIGDADVQGPHPPPQPSQTQQEPFQAGAGARDDEDSDDDEALKLRLDVAELRLKLHLAGGSGSVGTEREEQGLAVRAFMANGEARAQGGGY